MYQTEVQDHSKAKGLLEKIEEAPKSFGQLPQGLVEEGGDFDDGEQRTKDELDEEVNKRYEESKSQAKVAEEDEEDYEDDEFQEDLKEDTIKTEKIE
mmetsp:Transcript_36432/g.55929  ORF Transcript_36432/g.55929 Transcript_36432/m.55929 type:complete len:97 (+) Transcript_36432:32-322(+)